MIRVNLIILLLFSILQGSENSAFLLFERGNEAYRSGDYQKAKELYEQALGENYVSPELYFNLGNTFFKLNRVGWAILYYEKALLMNPSDQDIKFNLQLAKLRKVDKIDMPDPSFIVALYYKIRNSMNARNWGQLFGLFVLFLGIIISLRQFADREIFKKILNILLIITIVILILVSPFFLNRLSYEKTNDRGIIVDAEVKVMGAPYDSGTELFVIHEGTELKILQRNEGWFKIELIDGKQGWIKKIHLGVI